MSANTSTVASMVLATEEYLGAGSPEQPSCKAVREEVTSPQTEKVLRALTVQSEVMVAIMPRLEAIVAASKEAPPVHQYPKVVQPVHNYREVVGQQRIVRGPTSVGKQPMSCFVGEVCT